MATERTVRQLRVRAPDEALARRARMLLEDALRTASLPGDGAAVVLVRRLSLPAFSSASTPQSLALALEAYCRSLQIVTVSEATTEDELAAAAAVRFRDPLHARQDLGLRLLAAGWHGRQELVGSVDQQGLPRLRPLLRQRTRWSQGNLQAMDLLRTVMRSPFPLLARMELFAYMLMPLWQGVVGVAFVAALALAVVGDVSLWGHGLTWELAVVYLLGFGGTVMGAVAARRGMGWMGPVRGFLVGHVYALYSLLLWPVLVRSLLRQFAGRDGWAKTAREPVEEGRTPAEAPRAKALV